MRRTVPADLCVIMFDLDGTLIDTMGGFADVAAAVMTERHGLDPVVARRRYLETSGIPFRQQLELIVPGDPRNDSASDTFEQRKRGCADAANLDARTLAALERLRDQGLALVVSSNSAQYFVDEFAARQAFRFDSVLGFVDGVAGEPAFAKGQPHVERTCRELGTTPARILFCGDSLKDGELARDAALGGFVGRLGTFTADDFRRFDPACTAVADIHALADLIAARAAA